MDLHPNPSLNIPDQIDLGEYCYLCWLVASQRCRVFRWFYFKPQKEGFTYSFTVMTSKYSSWRKSVSIDPIDSLNDKNDATLTYWSSIQEKHETGSDKELHFADVDVDADSNSLK